MNGYRGSWFLALRARRGLGVLAGLGVFAGLSALGCEQPPPKHESGTTSDTPDQTAVSQVAVPSAPPAVKLLKRGTQRESASLAPVQLEGKAAVLIADEQDKRISVLVEDSGEVLPTPELECAPKSLVVDSQGRVTAAHPRCGTLAQYTLRKDGSHYLWHKEHETDVAEEPVALSLTPQGDSVLAVSAWGRALSVLDADSLSVNKQVAVGREPRAVSVSDTGDWAYVAHAVGGQLTRVSLRDNSVVESSLNARRQKARRFSRRRFIHARRFEPDFFGIERPQRLVRARRSPSVRSAPLFATQGFSVVAREGKVWVPQVLSNVGDPFQQPIGYGMSFDRFPNALQDIGVFDEAEEDSNRDNKPFGIIRGWSTARRNTCKLPRAAAFDRRRHTLLVACEGSDQVLEMDALARDPARTELVRWEVPRGPSAVALLEGARRLYVWSSIARQVSTLELSSEPTLRGGEHTPEAEQRRRQKIPRGRVSETWHVPETNGYTDKALSLAHGYEIFHRSGDTRISKDGRACASCHPAGRDDGLSWRTPGGLRERQTPMLDGRLMDTAPYGWLGEHQTLEVHLTNTVKNRLHGKGLSKPELAALITYITEGLSGPPRRAPVLTAAAKRGEQIFHNDNAGCGDCHYADGGTDGEQWALTGKVQRDTPSLRHIAGAEPYFHDGEYLTLTAMLDHTNGVMGQQRQLSSNEKSDLLEYLKTL